MENWAPIGKAPTSYLESLDQAITSSEQRRENFYSMHGMQSILNVFTSKHRFVISNKALSISNDELIVSDCSNIQGVGKLNTPERENS